MGSYLIRVKGAAIDLTNSINLFKDIFMLRSDARFTQYFMIKNNFHPSEVNTLPPLKTKNPEEKQCFLHNLVDECLRDLLPLFKQSKLICPAARRKDILYYE